MKRTDPSRNSFVPLSRVLFTACVVPPCVVEERPQDSHTLQDLSVADAARRHREQKKNARKQSRVISNEDLDTEYFKPGQEGLSWAPAKSKTEALRASWTVTTEAADQAATSANNEPRPKDADSEEAGAEDAEIAKLKKEIAEAEEDLKWQRRELALDQGTIYSNPNYTDFQTRKAKLDSEQQRINERLREIQGLKGTPCRAGRASRAPKASCSL
jgi:hypothetical protein